MSNKSEDKGNKKKRNFGWIMVLPLDLMIVLLYLVMKKNVAMMACLLLLLFVDIFVGSVINAIVKDKYSNQNSDKDKLEFLEEKEAGEEGRTGKGRKTEEERGSEEEIVLVGENNMEVSAEPADENKSENSKSKSKSVSKKKMKQKKNLQMLQYGTAILAFLSMLTTAEGMKDFVFEKEWMAYIGSMAVQMILVVFSLVLCELYVKITAQKHWKYWVRQVAINGLTLFFCLSIFVSSVFSFSYISNNAYAQSWSSDRDILIDNYLTLETERLRRENEYRGERFLKEIREIAEQNIQTVADDLRIQAGEDIRAAVDSSHLLTEIDDFEREFHHLRENKDGIQNVTNAVEAWRYDFADMQALYTLRRLQELNILIDGYRQYEDSYAGQARAALDILGNIREAFNNMDQDDANAGDIEGILQIAIEKLEIVNGYLEQMEEDINEVETYFFNQDFSEPRSAYRLKVKALVNAIDQVVSSLIVTKNKIAELQSRVEYVNADQIISEVYALGMNDSTLAEDIEIELSNMMETALEMDAVDSTNLQKIVELLDWIKKYEQYLVLSDRLEEYEEGNLSNTYNIETGGNKNEEENIEGESVQVQWVTETEWSRIRRNDFFDFIGMVKALPGIDDEDRVSVYDIGVTVSEANVLRRDLLGEITDLERAILYFKYDYKIMAIFSLFMALFLDLGAFLTGCFMYLSDAMKRVHKNKRN